MTRLRALLALTCGLWPAACFDSDEKFKLAETTTTSATTSTTDVDPTTTSTTSTSTGGGNTGTCRDGISCIIECALDVITSMDPEPDLSCLLDCVETMLSVEEAKELLVFANCASELCEAEMQCETGETSTGGSSSSGGESSSTTAEPPPPPLIDPCIMCIFNKLQLDPDEDAAELMQCRELAVECT
jgi:hypothetical protein